MASGAEYRATLDDRGTGGAYALPGTTSPRAAGLHLTSATTCDPEMVETRTVDTGVFVWMSPVRITGAPCRKMDPKVATAPQTQMSSNDKDRDKDKVE